MSNPDGIDFFPQHAFPTHDHPPRTCRPDAPVPRGLRNRTAGRDRYRGGARTGRTTARPGSPCRCRGVLRQARREQPLAAERGVPHARGGCGRHPRALGAGQSIPEPGRRTKTGCDRARPPAPHRGPPVTGRAAPERGAAETARRHREAAAAPAVRHPDDPRRCVLCQRPGRRGGEDAARPESPPAHARAAPGQPATAVGRPGPGLELRSLRMGQRQP